MLSTANPNLVLRHPIAQSNIVLTKLQTNKQPNTYMYLNGHTFKVIVIKGNFVDQPSCKSFSELIDGYQVNKTVP